MNNEKENTGAVIIIQDISQQEKLEKMRKDFIANVSYKFRTPLTILRGNLEALYDNVIPDEEIPQYYLTLLQETKRLENMVKDLLDLSKFEYGNVDMHFENVDIKSLLQDIIRVLNPITKEKNIQLHLIAMDNIIPIWSGYDKLKQLFLIFIDNAIKFSNNNSTVKLSVELKNSISVTIRDFGIGIPKEAIPHIGERFYKADKSRKYSTKGTGLGMSIANHLVQILNCKLKIESDLNIGTKIEITF